MLLFDTQSNKESSIKHVIILKEGGGGERIWPITTVCINFQNIYGQLTKKKRREVKIDQKTTT